MGTEHRGGRPGSYYAVLGVRPDASAGEIRSAYRKLAMKWHPDRRVAREPWLVEEANKRFQQLQEAYQVLADERRRTLYDAGLYDPVQDDEGEVEGFHDFVQEMLTLMADVRREEKQYSLEELQRMLAEMAQDFATPPTPPTPPYWFGGGGASRSSKRFHDDTDPTATRKRRVHVSSVEVFGSTGYW
ncbi:dnaJ homolog subfamily B member 3-like [Phoenix dactylifera]|uniref:DnaJ homolog subfamily B member 3-like n=1 Tax=Phoenix dactylifera TaxID=42345 RepID=A0A8B7D1S9_PHODC|nr:dnaJ homolog subfamily B member 3-like [Phoenix dactylifera]